MRTIAKLSVFLLTGCGQQVTCPCVEAPGSSSSGSGSGAAALKGCDGIPVPAADGLLDDFEDDDGQVTVLDGRDGYWWKNADPMGSKFTAPPDGASLKWIDGGANGSAKALHVAGTTAGGSDDAYGIEVGTNVVSAKGETYDASRYVGISFMAKAGQSSIKKVRLNVGDVNTHPDLNACDNCWNHFRKDFTLTTEWQEYRASFEELEQRPGWGSPRPNAVSADKIYTVTFAIEGGGDFELFVDDVQFLECKKL